jgi:hypothetical protein
MRMSGEKLKRGIQDAVQESIDETESGLAVDKCNSPSRDVFKASITREVSE